MVEENKEIRAGSKGNLAPQLDALDATNEQICNFFNVTPVDKPEIGKGLLSLKRKKNGNIYDARLLDEQELNRAIGASSSFSLRPLVECIWCIGILVKEKVVRSNGIPE